MALCNQCGNQIIHGSGLTCLVCQHTGRGEPPEHIIITPKGQDPHTPIAEALIMAQAAALDAAFDAMKARAPELEAFMTVLEAQEGLATRMKFNDHSRQDERPNWAKIDEEESEAQYEPVCQSCLGTGRYGNRRCPDCREDEE